MIRHCWLLVRWRSPCWPGCYETWLPRSTCMIRKSTHSWHATPDAAIFTSLPGAADALAPRLLAAFGSDRQRMDKAKEMQNFSGIAPITKRSGRQTRIQRRWACPKFLLQTFHEFAGCSLKKSVWAKDLLRPSEKPGKETPYRRPNFGFQMDTHRLSLLEEPYTV